jgi:hypothetical protein
MNDEVRGLRERLIEERCYTMYQNLKDDVKRRWRLRLRAVIMVIERGGEQG